MTTHILPAAGSADELVDAVEKMPDLDTRGEIHNLVVRFYHDVVLDDLLGPIFGKVAEVDWSLHIPRLIDFWCRVLLGHPGYDGYILAPHQAIHEFEGVQG